MPKLCERMWQAVGKCATAATYARQLPEGQVKLTARWADHGALLPDS